MGSRTKRAQKQKKPHGRPRSGGGAPPAQRRGRFFTPNAQDAVHFTLLHGPGGGGSIPLAPVQPPVRAAPVAGDDNGEHVHQNKAWRARDAVGHGGVYAPGQRILLVGEGDFSFTEALVVALEAAATRATPAASAGQTQVTATSLDSRSELLEKYGAAATARLTKLAAHNGVVLRHGVDAADAAKLSADAVVRARAPFERVVFNFPHVGGGSRAEEAAANRELVAGFLTAARRLLAPPPAGAARSDGDGGDHGGEVHLRVRGGGFYGDERVFGGVEALARRAGLRVRGRAPFEAAYWMGLGYRAQRTRPATRPAPEVDDAELIVMVAGEDGDDDGSSIGSGSGSSVGDGEEDGRVGATVVNERRAKTLPGPAKNVRKAEVKGRAGKVGKAGGVRTGNKRRDRAIRRGRAATNVK